MTTAEQHGAGGAVRISGSFGRTAPAEVVVGVLTDPDRIYRRLPRGMNTESATGGEVRVRVGARAARRGHGPPAA